MAPEITEPLLTRQIAGATVTFVKLSPRERGTILRKVKAERKSVLAANLRLADIDKEQMLVELENFDDRPWGQRQWLDYLNTLQGQEEIIRLAWSKQNAGDPSRTIDFIETADGGLLPLAAALCNVQLSPSDELDGN